MSRWNEKQYLQHAQNIARDHAASGVSLTSLSEKIARDNGLNPDEIRTLVRLSNVAAFQELFQKKASEGDSDRMVEFERGDPEAVIRRLVDQASVSAEPASLEHKYAAYEAPDMMTEKRLGRAFDAPSTEKTASEDLPIRPASPEQVILSLRKVAEEMDVERRRLEMVWSDRLSKIASAFKRAPGYGKLSGEELEKAAYATLGEESTLELKALQDVYGVKEDLQQYREAVAHYQDHHLPDSKPEYELLKEAVEARKQYQKLEEGLAWIASNTPKVKR